MLHICMLKQKRCNINFKWEKSGNNRIRILLQFNSKESIYTLNTMFCPDKTIRPKICLFPEPEFFLFNRRYAKLQYINPYGSKRNFTEICTTK